MERNNFLKIFSNRGNDTSESPWLRTRYPKLGFFGIATITLKGAREKIVNTEIGL